MLIPNNRNITFAMILAFILAGGAYSQPASKSQSVRVINTVEEPVPVKVVKEGTSKKRVQFTTGADIGPGGSGRSVLFPIPAGKRFVIEHVSARTYRPPGLRMNIEFGTYFDNGDIFGPDQGLAFHGVSLIEQGTELNGYEVASANHAALAFAEERIGTANNLPIRVRISLSGTVPFGHFARGTIVFTGYVEDHPPTQ